MKKLLKSHTLRIVVPQHLMVLAGLVSIALGYSSPLWLLAIPVGYVILGYIGGAIFVHRYWCHNSFETYPVIARLGAYFGLLGGIGTVIAMYVVHVHHHHRFTDTEQDPHSPRWGGRFRAWLTWKDESDKYFNGAARKLPKRIVTDPYLRWMHKHYYTIWWTSIIAITLVSWQFAIFFVAAAGVYHYHMEGFVNAYCHDNYNNGYRNGETNDLSINHNSKLMMYISWGSTLHNNHHMYPTRYSYALKPGEWDVASWIVPLLRKR